MRNFLKSQRVMIPGLVLAVSGLALAPACDSNSGETNVASVVTYNVGLATGYVDYAPQRQSKLVEIIAGLDADAVCLQEVWSQDQIDAFVQGTADAFPYNHYVFDTDDTLLPPQCTDTEASSIGTCVKAECADVPSSELASCVIGDGPCVAEFSALTGECQTCAATNLGKAIDEILAICTTQSVKYSWGGHNGLLVLSKSEITGTHHTKLSSSLVQRSVVGVDIALGSAGPASLFCTHLAADLSADIKYIGDFESFEAENAAQTEEMLTFIDANANGTVLIVGDVNSGPEVAPDIAAEIPDAAYKLIMDAGYGDAPTDIGPMCTWCSSNTFVDADASNLTIDHVFTKGLAVGVFAAGIQAVGTETFEVTPEGGSPVQTNPSDHYGFRVQFDKK